MAQKEFERGAGILMHISSIPSPYGIGSFGKNAYEFVDRLVAARQKYWQVLPLGTTSYGDSPYASFSAIAGNTYLIDLDTLIEEGLITKEYVDSFRWNIEEQYVMLNFLIVVGACSFLVAAAQALPLFFGV